MLDLARGDGDPLAAALWLIAYTGARRGEVLTGDGEFMTVDGLHIGNWFVSNPVVGPGFSFVHLGTHYPPRERFGSAPPIDAVWLDGADLAVVETVYAGRVTRSIVAEGFKMGSPSAAP